MSNIVHQMRMKEAKRLASHIMHMQCCEYQAGKESFLLGPDVVLPEGESKHELHGEKASARKIDGSAEEETYHVEELEPGLFLVTGEMTLLSDLKRNESLPVKQHMTLLVREAGVTLRCVHIHCSAAGDEDYAKTLIFTHQDEAEKGVRESSLLEEETSRALKAACEAADRASLVKSEFLSKMSHNIKTPMSAILGLAEIAGQKLMNREDVKDCLDEIKTEGTFLLGLINEALDMSELEAGTMMLSEEEFYLSQLIDCSVAQMEPEVKKRRQHLTLQYGEIRHNAVRGDAACLRQILAGLLTNASKYTEEEGSICVTVCEKFHLQGGICCFEFVVEDNGIGMSQEFLQKLFEPFERAEDSRISRVQGTGLGMAITKNLVRMLNGSISVTSEPGQGTCFTVLVCLKNAEANQGAGNSEASQAVEENAFPPQTHVLLVEDHDVNREIARKILKFHGLKVTTAGNGKEAFMLFAGNPPGTYQLILMDVQMPVMDGYQATKEIRRLAESKGRADAADIPIIALTANAFAEDICRSRQAGMNDLISKPLDARHLIRVLRGWIHS